MLLSEIQTTLGFTEPKAARNLSDWLRATGEVEYVDRKVYYSTETIAKVLADKLEHIKENYPSSYESCIAFIAEAKEIQRIDEKYLPHTEIQQPTPEIAITEQPALKKALTSKSALLYATVFVTLVFWPFTALNLHQYISIKGETELQKWAVFFLCWAIAAAWDFSILLFAVNRKEKLAIVGSCVLCVFMGAKFDFFKLMFDAIALNGAALQQAIVLFCMVFYSPLLVFQLTKLTMQDDKI